MQEYKKGPLNLFQPPEPIKIKPQSALPDPHEMARLMGLQDAGMSEKDKQEAERDEAQAKEAELEEAERVELEARAAARAKRAEERRLRAICCCGSRLCCIGPFNRIVDDGG